jgi:radial spoke head protein 9
MGVDSNELVRSLDQLSLAGVILSIEQKVSLENSLIIARDQYKFNRIFLWGKILGSKEDYFIAVGVGSSEIEKRTFLYSHDCIRWKLLNPPTNEHFERLKHCRGRFQGDPSFEFECKIFRLVGEGEDEHITEDVVIYFKLKFNSF